jgi:hypothetical protein
MATIPWPTLQTWLERNPFQTAALKPYELATETVSGPTEQQASDGWTRIPVQPATPLSAVLLAQDAMYSASPLSGRRALLRDELTDLQERALLHLKGRQWPVRKTAEGLAAAGLEEGRASTWPAIGWKAICALRECQLIVVNESARSIAFFPEDVRTWSPDVDVLFVEHEARMIWVPTGTPNIRKWISDHEHEGWTIEWPLADGGMEELKSSAQTLHETLPPKINKDALRKKVGRAQSIHALLPWETKN